MRWKPSPEGGALEPESSAGHSFALGTSEAAILKGWLDPEGLESEPSTGWGFSEGTHGVPESAGMLELELFVGWEAWGATLAGWLECPLLFSLLPLCWVLERVRVHTLSAESQFAGVLWLSWL